jgi:hypothetical protein
VLDPSIDAQAVMTEMIRPFLISHESNEKEHE